MSSSALDMHEPESLDSRFQQAVAFIDEGNVTGLHRFLNSHPNLVRDRLESPGPWLRDKVGNAVAAGEFFHRPYLLWFVAEDPVRNGKLPSNIAQVALAIIDAANRLPDSTLPSQLDYALRLVAWYWIARDCGVQNQLIDVLVNAGANTPQTLPHDALVNGNFAAAACLVQRGARLTLATALCLGKWADAAILAATATHHDRQVALVLCSLNGQSEALRRLLALGVDLNAFSTDIYSHATALHHAVCSGSLEAVKVLVQAGARLDIKDRAWNATPLQWANHYCAAPNPRTAGKSYADIKDFLSSKGDHP